MAQVSPEMQIDVLNCTDGDTKLTFNPADALEVEKARRVITDMLRRGYSLFIEVDGKTTRVMEFDEKRGEYLVAWGPSDSAVPREGPTDLVHTPKHRRRVKAAGTRATSVAPTAGG